MMQLGALTEKLAANIPSRQDCQSLNITKVEELIFSQEDAPGTHISPREIKQITGIARSSVVTLTDYLDCRVTTLTDVTHYVLGPT